MLEIERAADGGGHGVQRGELAGAALGFLEKPGIFNRDADHAADAFQEIDLPRGKRIGLRRGDVENTDDRSAPLERHPDERAQPLLALGQVEELLFGVVDDDHLSRFEYLGRFFFGREVGPNRIDILFGKPLMGGQHDPAGRVLLELDASPDPSRDLEHFVQRYVQQLVHAKRLAHGDGDGVQHRLLVSAPLGFLEKPGVGEGDRRPVGQLLQEIDLGWAELPRLVGERPEYSHDLSAAREQRNSDVAPDAELADRPPGGNGLVLGRIADDQRAAVVDDPLGAALDPSHLIQELGIYPGRADAPDAAFLQKPDVGDIGPEELAHLVGDLLKQGIDIQLGDVLAHFLEELLNLLLSLGLFKEPGVFHRNPDHVADRLQQILLARGEGNRPGGRNVEDAHDLPLRLEGNPGHRPAAVAAALLVELRPLGFVDDERLPGRKHLIVFAAGSFWAQQGCGVLVGDAPVGGQLDFAGERIFKPDVAFFAPRHLQHLVQRKPEHFIEPERLAGRGRDGGKRRLLLSSLFGLFEKERVLQCDAGAVGQLLEGVDLLLLELSRPVGERPQNADDRSAAGEERHREISPDAQPRDEISAGRGVLYGRVRNHERRAML